MNKLFVASSALALCLAASGTALAGKDKTGNGAPSGSHYTVNLIGVKNPKNFDEGAESSGGSSMFIPLRTTQQPSHFDDGEGTCTDTNGNQTDFVDDTFPNWQTTDPAPGTKITFTPTTTGNFEVLDRDATDGEGEIQIPVDSGPGKWVQYDLFVRVLGKPGGCAEISGYAYDSTGSATGGDSWWYSGTIYLDRTGGKSTFVKATDIFDVWYCDLTTDTSGAVVCADSPEEISVFNDVFEDYFWAVANYDTKLIQLRFYPKD